MRTALALLALVLLAGPPVAAQGDAAAEESTSPGPLRWVRIGITDADTLWYDPETVLNPEPDVYRVWVLESRGRGATLPTGESYSLVRELSDFHCALRRSRRRELIFLTAEDSLVRAYTWGTEEMEWRQPLPGTDVEFILREVCERVR